jgi:sugar phosphate isomerase/epimerase
MPEGYSKDQMRKWVVEGFKECTTYGKKFGVIVAVQNHAAFIKTAEEVKRLIKLVNHKWFGLVEDVGSFPAVDPYKEIAEVIPFAVNWQIKENLHTDKGSEKTDLKKLFSIIKKGGYRGYLPIETLGEGDPREKVARFLTEVRTALKEI